MLVNKGTLQSLNVAYSALFEMGLSLSGNDWRKVATKVPCSTKKLEMSWLTQIPDVKLSVGPEVYEDAVNSTYEINHHPYKTKMEVNVDNLEDDNIGTHRMMVSAHGRQAGGWLGRAAFTLLPRGLTSSGKGFDGVNFFSASHPLHNGSNYSNFANDSNAPWYLLDTRAAVMPLVISERKPFSMTMQGMPTDDVSFDDDKIRWKIRGRYGFGYGFPQTAYCSKKTLNETNLEAAITAMTSLTREDGQKLDIEPTMLVVGPSNRFAAEKLLKAMLKNESVAGTNIHYNRFELVVNQHVESVGITLGT